MPDLGAYLERIGFDGPIHPDLETLRAVHRQHAYSIPYESLDVYLEVPVDQAIDRIFDKLVTGRRGGWCYEMNGLLGWALGELGFSVTRMLGGVFRAAGGDEAFGNHVVLRVDLEEPWIADVGLGDGIIEPMPLRVGEMTQFGRTFRLERLTEDEWRFHNRAGAVPDTFDFLEGTADEVRLEAVGETLQANPDSLFRQNLVCQLMSESGVDSLLGRRLTRPSGERRLLNSEAELVEVLTHTFGIRVPEITGLCQKVASNLPPSTRQEWGWQPSVPAGNRPLIMDLDQVPSQLLEYGQLECLDTLISTGLDPGLKKPSTKRGVWIEWAFVSIQN